MKHKVTMLSMVFVLLVAGAATAAPSLEITKPPVGPIPSWSGPVQDPDAIMGQWFKHINPLTGAVGMEEARTHEFFDNKTGYGGGFASTAAIKGLVTSLTWAGTPYQSNLIAFDVTATITNDTPGDISIEKWLDGTNSHSEYLNTTEQYTGTLFDTKLAIEFAVDAAALAAWDPAGTKINNTPYHDITPHIIAEEHDELGWYCWTPGNGDPELQPEGDYLVPTYDFGDILPGQSVTRVLSFVIGGEGLVEGDERLAVILDGNDIFLNRTTSLKISNWIEGIGIDDGTPYPSESENGTLATLNSDVSVFHNIPEPMTICILSVGGLMFARKRRA